MQEDVSVVRLVLPATEAVDVHLEPRSYLSRADRAQRLSGRMSLGAPILVPIPVASVDAGVLEPYLVREAATSVFYLLHLVVNLRPDDRAPFAELGVGVALSCPDGATGNGSGPIAWSLSPLRAAETTGVSTTVGLNGKFGIVEPQATRTVEGQSEYAIGMGERESDFEWRFTATPARGLAGAQHMYAVVKARGGTETRADIIVSASVRLSALGLIPYRAELPPLLARIASPCP
ncbi:hypothetical protein OG787_12035 [Streptomyces sp. NBC_00075]|uniref:hypothetical protein n=1 Tax=Streptomyces sp. NBC_00075 TaxID=2975641 RepID=UPI00324B8220